MTSSNFPASDLHVWPDYHGNRCPLADPNMKGMVSGLTLSAKTPQDLALKYLATLQALAYGTRLILDRLAEGGHQVFLLGTGIFAIKDDLLITSFQRQKHHQTKMYITSNTSFW